MKLLAAGMALTLAGCVGDWSQSGSDAAHNGGMHENEAGAESIEPALVDASIGRDPGTDTPLLQAADASSVGPSEATWSSEAGVAEAPEASLVEGGGRPDAAGVGADSGIEAGLVEAGAGAANDAGLDAAPPLRIAAVASVDTACDTALELACSAHNVAQKLVCLNGKWSFNGSCDGATRCDTRLGVSQGTCQAITARCLGKLPGAAVCDGLMRKSCGLDLLDELPQACTAHAHCEGGDASCVCDRGFMSSASGCVDIPDCAAGACANGRCVEGTESYTCTCDSGFHAAADQHSCVDNIDCTPGICGVGGTCSEGVNDYTCSCASGYEKKTGQKSCSNIDNCVGNPCAPGVCNDGVNQYTCTCQSPWLAISWDGVSWMCVHECDVPCGCGSCSG